MCSFLFLEEDLFDQLPWYISSDLRHSDDHAVILNKMRLQDTKKGPSHKSEQKSDQLYAT